MTDPSNGGIEDKQYQFKPFRVPKYQIKFEKASKLSDIEGYVWFTPAALYAWGRFSETNLSEIVSRTDIKIFWYKFDKPIFSNFGPDWGHMLWAVTAESWTTFVDGVLETVQFDIPRQVLYQYALQVVSILDPLSVEKDRVVLSTTPEIQINAFAVLSNTGQLAFDSKVKPVKGKLPGMNTFKPDPVHVKAANMLFSDANITQDDAFQKYGDIMKRLNDAAYEVEAEQKYQESRRRKR